MKLRKTLAGLLCALLVIGVCGCGGKSGTDTSLDGERSLTHKITDEPLKLSYFAMNKEDYKDQSIWMKAFDMTNILVEPTLSENTTDMNQALALAIAAKEIPDIVYDYMQQNFNRYGLQGALIPLNDLIDQYAPNYKKFLEENPDILYYSTASDGNIYFIPFIAGGEATTGWFVRQDWLDKLNMKAPNTIDEFYQTLVAFRDQDPNGNGQKDEVPFFGIASDVASLLSMFDAYDSFRYTTDGKVSFGPMEDNFLTGMKEISKWYQEGLIDKEFFTRSDSQDYFTSNNTGGITHEWFGSTSKKNDSLKDTIPGFKFVPFAPVEGIDGVRRENNRRTRTDGEGWGISAMNKHPEETMKYFDFWFTEEGRRLVNFGIEGVHYDMVDGKPTFKEELLKCSDPPITTVMMSIRSMTNFGFWQDYEYEKSWTNDIAKEGTKMYVENGYLPDPLTRPLLSYFENEKEQSTLKTQIETFVDETVQKWIFGEKDPDADFASFKETLKTLGVDQYIANEEAAYKKYLEMVAK